MLNNRHKAGEVNNKEGKILTQDKNNGNKDLNQKIQIKDHQVDLNKDPQDLKIPMERKDKDQQEDLNKSHPSLNNLKMENKENHNKMEKNKENKKKNKKVKFLQLQLQ